MLQGDTADREYTLFSLFCGLGGGGIGAQRARAAHRDLAACCRLIGGVDVDPGSCTDFEMLTGVKATCLDLFDRDQYRKWHGREPGAEWREVAVDDMHRAAAHQNPDIVLVTAPCKGFSGLLGKDRAQSEKYEALNRLTVRGILLTVEAWRPAFILFENVPGIRTRGQRFLDEIRQLLTHYGYVFEMSHHDCGEIGNLAQSRRRFLLVCRHPERCSNFLYHPPRHKLRPIEDVLDRLPLPEDPAGGPMHTIPRLSWRTWVRLALIKPGGDWRDLQSISPGQYRIEPLEGRPGAFRIVENTAAAECSDATVDPHLQEHMQEGTTHPGKYAVKDAAGPGHTVTGARLGSGMGAVADPRIGHTPFGNTKGAYHVQDSTGPGATVIGSVQVNKSGGNCVVADGRYGNMLRVSDAAGPSGTVTAAAGVHQGGALVADPRFGCNARSGTMSVLDSTGPASTVIGHGDVHTAGATTVADHRIDRQDAIGNGGGGEWSVPDDNERGVWFILSPHTDRKGRHCWHRPFTRLELMALQGFDTVHPDGSPVALSGQSAQAHLMRIGNALPPPAAEAIVGECLRSMLASDQQEFLLGHEIWVMPSAEDGEHEIP